MATSSSPNPNELVIADHTTIIRAVIEHKGFLRDGIGVVGYRALGMSPPPQQMFECLLTAPGLDHDTVSRIKVLLSNLGDFEASLRAARWTAPEQMLLASVGSVSRSARSTRGKIRVLKDLADAHRERASGFEPIIETAVAILEDGLGVVYRDAGPDAGSEPSQPDAGGDEGEVEEDCAGQDVIGATSGGILGGLKGAIIGAAVGSGLCLIF